MYIEVNFLLIYLYYNLKKKINVVKFLNNNEII